MKQRRFRLESVLRLRALELDRAGTALGDALRAEQTLRGLRQHREQRSAEGAVQLQRLLGTGPAPAALRTATGGVAALYDDIRQTDAQLASAGEEVGRARDVVRDARGRVRVLERLRERFEAELRREDERASNRELDDVAMRRRRGA